LRECQSSVDAAFSSGQNTTTAESSVCRFIAHSPASPSIRRTARGPCAKQPQSSPRWWFRQGRCWQKGGETRDNNGLVLSGDGGGGELFHNGAGNCEFSPKLHELRWLTVCLDFMLKTATFPVFRC
jgi:hypothetical protein